MKRNLIFSFLLLLICFIAAGCASFPGGELPKRNYSDINPPSSKPSVDYDASFFALGSRNTAGDKMLRREIEKVFLKSDYFEKVSSGEGDQKYHITIELKNEGNAGLAFASGFISGFTMFVVPGYAKDEYVLTADVKKGDDVVKSYRYKDHMKTWTQLFLVFLAPMHWPPTTATEIIDGMLLNLIYDIEKDGLLEA